MVAASADFWAPLPARRIAGAPATTLCAVAHRIRKRFHRILSALEDDHVNLRDAFRVFRCTRGIGVIGVGEAAGSALSTLTRDPGLTPECHLNTPSASVSHRTESPAVTLWTSVSWSLPPIHVHLLNTLLVLDNPHLHLLRSTKKAAGSTAPS